MFRAACLALALTVTLSACERRMPAPAANDGPTLRIIEYASVGERVVIEATDGRIVPPYEIVEDGEASGGRSVVLAEVWTTGEELNPAFCTLDGRPVSKDSLGATPLGEPLVPNGMVELSFSVPKTAEYAFWARCWFGGPCGDTLYFSIDTDPPVDTTGDGHYDVNTPFVLGGTTHRSWQWFTYRGTFHLEEGEHVLRIFPREDGLKIDQLLFVEQSDELDRYVPQGIERP